MAATTAIYQYTGSGPTGTSITNLRYASADIANDGGTYTLVKPASSYTYSYVAWVALYVSSAPAGSITNVKWFSDGGNGFGTGITVKGIQTNTYTQATGTAGSSGDLSAAVYTSGTDVFTYTTGSPLSVSSNATTGTGRYSYYVPTQMRLDSTASAATTPSETFTFRFDET